MRSVRPPGGVYCVHGSRQKFFAFVILEASIAVHFVRPVDSFPIFADTGQVCRETSVAQSQVSDFLFAVEYIVLFGAASAAFESVFSYLHKLLSGWPNKSPEPTAVGAVSSAIAVHVASRLSFAVRVGRNRSMFCVWTVFRSSWLVWIWT